MVNRLLLPPLSKPSGNDPEKAVADAVNAAMIEFATEKARLETTLADVQRKLQARTPHDRGEPAEQSLHDALVAVLPPTDIVRRVEKGQPGVDVVVEIVLGNSVISKIVIELEGARPLAEFVLHQAPF